MTAPANNDTSRCAARYSNPVIAGECELPHGHSGAHRRTISMWQLIWTKAWASVIRL